MAGVRSLITCAVAKEAGRQGRKRNGQTQLLVGLGRQRRGAFDRDRAWRRTSIPPAPSPSSIRFRPAAPPTWWRGRSRPCWSRMLKQPVVIETKAGAAGQVGAQFAAAAKPDGYTLLMHIVSISGFAEVDKLYGRPVKFTRDDFIPIARFIADPMVLVVNDQQPYKTLKEFVDDAKKRPNELDLQLVGHARRAASADGAVHEGGRHPDAASADQRRRPGPDRPARQQLRRCWCSSIAAANSQIKAGKARALACFGAQRSPALPDVPTMKELGYNIEFYLWVGMFAPKGTPDADRHQAARGRPRRPSPTEQFKQAMTNLGQDVAYLDQAEFKAFWDADAKRVEEAVRADRQGVSGDGRAGGRRSRGSLVTSAQGPRRRRCVRRSPAPPCLRSAATCRSAPWLARRRHAAEAGHRPDDGVRRWSCWCAPARARRSPTSTGATCPHAVRVVAVDGGGHRALRAARLSRHHGAAAVRPDFRRRAQAARCPPPPSASA